MMHLYSFQLQLHVASDIRGVSRMGVGVLI